MGWTKRQLVERAYANIGMAPHVYDIQPEQMQAAIIDMDAMVAQWNGKDIALAYALTSDPDNADPDQDSGLPDWANAGVFLQLALVLAGQHGRTMSAETKTAAKDGLDTIKLRASKPTLQVQLPRTMPLGAGHKPWRTGNRNPFVTPPDTAPLQTGEGNDLQFLGDA